MHQKIKGENMKRKNYQKIIIILLVILIIIWSINAFLFIKINNDILNIVHEITNMKFEWCKI